MAQHIEVKEKLAMIIECPRCCLYYSIKLVNLIMLFFGIAIIIYSLWLDKKWHQFFSQLHPTSPPPFPWFIYTCLGVGIVVFLSTLCYYIAFNSISNYTICAYIFIACCLLFLEVAVIVIIFFKMDVVAQIASIIDECHKKIESFLTFHLKISRLIVLLISAAQEKKKKIMFGGNRFADECSCSFSDILGSRNGAKDRLQSVKRCIWLHSILFGT
ncbi:tetraspanin-19 isoform X2 [Manihot esculenta]|uniref:Tetraspanin n=1 Tax=Manihot esculenta TaxID=3983 RepID=A0A2C9W7I9_MANES|nr:tetraspanin-19 isoform X2 [Manihot esculenta]